MTRPGSPKKSAERRDNTQQTIDNLLKEREQLLVLYCKVAGLEPYPGDDALERMVSDFCQILVDYVAAVHFEIFSRLSEGKERRQSVLDVAGQNYNYIADSTQHAVDFNDRYDGGDPAEMRHALPEHLSRLGEVLANRFEKEDAVFAALLDRG